MTEIWFDARGYEGHLLIGEVAVIPELEQSGIGDLIPLQDILLSEELPVDPDRYRKHRVTEWTAEDYLALGSVAFKVIQRADPALTLERSHLQRLYDAGIAPRPRSMIGNNKPFESISELRDKIDAPQRYRPKGMFDAWTTDDYVEHARNVAVFAGGKPKMDDYIRYAAEHPEAPTFGIIHLRLKGGISLLNEYIGYPDTNGWGCDEYLDYGIKVLEVNGLAAFNQTLFVALSRGKRGPSHDSITRAFGSWSAYKAKVIETAEERNAENSENRARKIKSYHELIEKGGLPADYAELDEDLLIQRGARYVVMKELLRTAVVSEARQRTIIETQTPKAFVSAVMRAQANSVINAGHIEVTAEMLGVYDDLWTPDDYRHYLKVDEDQLQATKRARAAAQQRFRMRSQPAADTEPAAI